MDNKKIRAIGTAMLVAVWACLTMLAWFGPAAEMSEAERRPLAQLPEITGNALLSGDFMVDFEDYALDQFPLRDTFRQIKSLFHYNVLRQQDNNGIYIENGYAAKQEYPLNRDSLSHALDRFRHVYEKYLADSGSSVFLSIVPDKGYYLAGESGQPSLDYEEMFSFFREGMPWASYVDITGALSLEDYYHTDTHWRQESLLDAAQRLCEAMGVTVPQQEDFTVTALERPFYGVYYGQAALPMEPETMYIMESPLLNGCTVYDYESDSTSSVYNLDKLTSRDLYDVYLSGARSLLSIENSNGATERELIVFRDSFGSSMVPLLLQDYSRVTLVDIRYIQIDMLERFLKFDGQDVLFLYSTLVLNNSSTLK